MLYRKLFCLSKCRLTFLVVHREIRKSNWILRLCSKITLKTDYKKSNTEEDIHMTNQYKTVVLPNSVVFQDVVSKSYLDEKANNTSKIRNCSQNDFIAGNLDNVRFG